MSSARLRALLCTAIAALALSACSGGSGTQPQPAMPGALSQNAASDAGAAAGAGVPAAGERTVGAALEATSSTYAIPLARGYSAKLSLHATGVPAGTELLLGVRQPVAFDGRLGRAAGSRNEASRHKPACPATVTIPLYNPFRFAITLHVDGFTIGLPCSVNGTLFGVSFYQVQPVPATVSALKVGDVTASGNSITFTSDVTSITLPPHTETALSIVPESSTSEVGLPIVPGANTLLTSNAPSLPSSLAVNYLNSGGGGSLFSSACLPAYDGGKLDPALAGVVILGTPSYYCQLGTVDSATVLFGSPSVTFTIGAPLPDRSFISLDGPGSEYLCAPSGTTTCTTPAFTVPTIQNVIAGNVADLQVCLPATAGTNCNGNANPGTPAPAATTVPPNSAVDILVADDATYVSVRGTCTAPAICGGFSLDTSAGSCVINNGPDENGDVPGAPPPYKDPGGPQENPPVNSGTSTHAVFPAVGPYAEFDLISGASGTTCTVTVTETDGPLLRSTTYSIPVN